MVTFPRALVYRSVVCPHPTLVSPDLFQPARVQVRYTRVKAWTHIPGARPHVP